VRRGPVKEKEKTGGVGVGTRIAGEGRSGKARIQIWTHKSFVRKKRGREKKVLKKGTTAAVKQFHL